MVKQYAVEPFDSSRDRTGFSCGVPALDRYFHAQIGQDVRRYLAAAFVLIEKDTGDIAGYYTLSAAAIEVSDVPPEVTRKLPRYPSLPAALIGRLAVDQRHRGRGAGSGLLADALRRVLASEIRAMAVIVDAKDDAAIAFYAHHGFQPLLDQPNRLYITLADIARARGN